MQIKNTLYEKIVKWKRKYLSPVQMPETLKMLTAWSIN